MITARLKTPAGAVLAEFPLPEHLGEMTLQQFVSYDTLAAREGNAVAVMAAAVQDFTGVPISDIIAAQVGNVYKKRKALNDTLRGIHGYISNMIAGYAPALRDEADCRFSYKGHEYIIPMIRTTPLLSGAILPDLTVQQGIEALELLRLSEATKTERGGDPNGDIQFTTYLRMLAILALREGEELPADPAECERFIINRVHHFEDIDARTALDVDFFLHNTLRLYGINHDTAGFLIRRVSVLAVETLRLKGRLMIGRKRTTGKSLRA